MQAADRGVADLLTMTFPAAEALQVKHARALERSIQLIDRAKAAGHLRADFTHQDLAILLMANAGVVGATGQAAPDAWRRLVAYMLQAFAASGSAAQNAELPPAPTPAALYQATLQLGSTSRRG